MQGDEAGPSKNAGVAGVDNTARRQFDLEQFREQAAKRELEESELDGLTPYEVKQLKRRRVFLTQKMHKLHAWMDSAVKNWGPRFQVEIRSIRVSLSSGTSCKGETTNSI